MTLIDAIAAAGIQLRRYDVGTHRTACPYCNKGPRDDALAVTIHNEDDVVWVCHRCHWASGWSADWRRERYSTPRHAPKSSASRETPERIVGRDILAEISSRKLQRITPGDLAGRYLTGRNCPLPEFSVGFTAAEWHPQERRRFPCMVAIITNILTAKPISLHFTYLDPGGNGKADIEKPRLYLAGHRKKGGVVRLVPDAEVTMGVIIGEGLETCLTASLEYAPVWACLDADGIDSFPVLPGIEGLTVLVDNDDAGRRAFASVCERYTAAGMDVIEVAPQGGRGMDLNDRAAA